MRRFTLSAALSASLKVMSIASLIATACFISPANAYTLKKHDGSACAQDGAGCNVWCDNNTLAGTMFWNGNVWTDGLRSDEDKDVVARKIRDSNGTSCT